MGYISGNTFIYTRKGMKFIKDIQIGDEVLTHKGDFKTVLEKIEADSEEDTVGMSNGCESKTKNTMYIIPSQEIYMENGKWVQAQFVLDGFAKPNLWNKMGLTPKSFSIGGNNINNDKNIAFILGAYIARGFCDRGNVIFKFKGKVQSDRALNQIKKVFDKEYTVKQYVGNVGRGYAGGIEIVGSEVGDFFVKTFGKKHNEKRIPEWVSGKDKTYRKEMFRGIKTSPLWKEERCFMSVSNTLTYQVLLLGRSIGLYGWFHSEIQNMRSYGVNKAFFGNKGKVNDVICEQGIKDKMFGLKVQDNESFVAGDFIIRAV